MAGSLFVPVQDVADGRIEQRIVRGKDGSAGDAEDDVHALALEGVEQRVGPRDLHRAVTSPGVQSRRCEVSSSSAPPKSNPADRYVTSKPKNRSNCGRSAGSVTSMLTWAGPSHSTLATVRPPRSNSYRISSSPPSVLSAFLKNGLLVPSVVLGVEKTPRVAEGVGAGEARWARPRA